MSHEEIGVGDKFSGVFRPKALDTLKPDVVQHIGKTIHVHAGWVVEEGPYAGQWAFVVEDRDICIGWVPREDIEGMARVSR